MVVGFDALDWGDAGGEGLVDLVDDVDKMECVGKCEEILVAVEDEDDERIFKELPVRRTKLHWRLCVIDSVAVDVAGIKILSNLQEVPWVLWQWKLWVHVGDKIKRILEIVKWETHIVPIFDTVEHDNTCLRMKRAQDVSFTGDRIVDVVDEELI